MKKIIWITLIVLLCTLYSEFFAEAGTITKDKDISALFLPCGGREKGAARIRALNLAKALNKKGWHITLNDKNANNLEQYDFIFIQRATFSKKIEKLVTEAHEKKIPVIYDLDDLKMDRVGNLHHYDMVIASQDYLAQKLKSYNPNVVVIPNMVDVDDPNIPLKSRNKHKKVVWYGDGNNFRRIKGLGIHDIDVISKGLGIRDIDVISKENNIITYNVDTIDKQLQNYDLVIIPQTKSEFTLSKTHNRMLKALYLGIPVMVSDMPEFVSLASELNYPKEFIVSDPTQWNQKIESFKKGELVLNFDFKKGREKILELYGPDRIADIFEEKVLPLLQKNNRNQF